MEYCQVVMLHVIVNVFAHMIYIAHSTILFLQCDIQSKGYMMYGVKLISRKCVSNLIGANNSD